VGLHSEKESFRKALAFRAPDGSAATLLVMRRSKAMWVPFSGTAKTFLVMCDAETIDLITTLRAARDRS
jgi:hypothetical protein